MMFLVLKVTVTKGTVFSSYGPCARQRLWRGGASPRSGLCVLQTAGGTAVRVAKVPIIASFEPK